jgi:hypothetical protein
VSFPLVAGVIGNNEVTGNKNITANSDVSPSGTYYVMTAVSTDGAIIARAFVTIEPPGGTQDIGAFTYAQATPIAGVGVPTTRTITTTAPITGGGDLSANRTFALTTSPPASGTAVGTGRTITPTGFLIGGGDLSADRTISPNQTGPGNAGDVLFYSSGSGSGIGSDDGIFWDNTNKRLGVGTAGSPTQPLNVVNTIAGNSNQSLTKFQSTRSADGLSGTNAAVFVMSVVDNGTAAPAFFGCQSISLTKSAGSVSASVVPDALYFNSITCNENITELGGINFFTNTVAAGKTLTNLRLINMEAPGGAGTTTNAYGITQKSTAYKNSFGGAGATPNTTVDIGGSVSFRAGSDITLVNGLNSNVAVPLTGTMFRLVGPSAAFQIGGLTNGFDGRMIYLYTTITQAWTINNADGGSSAANQISGTKGALTATNEASAILMYSATLSKWVLFNHITA